MKNDPIKNITHKEEPKMAEIIGENNFLKLRKQKEQLKNELEQVKIQRDIALKKIKKILDIIDVKEK
jgi:hypothetical protein